jgi:serine/threonine-protein kinase
VVDPDGTRGAQLSAVAAAHECQIAGAAGTEEAWPLFARFRPDVVLLGLAPDSSTGEEFLRRLQTQFMGTMPGVYFVGEPELMARGVLEPDGLLIPPVTAESIARVLRPDLEIGDTKARQVIRLRELFELNALSKDLLGALDVLVSRASLTFRVDNCLVWGPSGDEYWPRSARVLTDDEKPEVMRRARQALETGVTSVVEVAGRPLSFLAAPLVGRSATGVGGICLIDGDGRIFSAEERDALRSFANRLAVELTFVSAHIRLLQTHDRLRESALLDPLLGVWTRAAFERAVVRQISAASASGLFLAVLDFVKLRAINDRHGHLAGDAVLAHLAKAVRESLRTQDQIGRFGGDELALLLSGCDADGATRLIETLLERLEASPYSRDGLSVPLSVTIGVTPILAGESSGESAFARALGALRRARRAQKRMQIIDVDEAAKHAAESSLVFDVGAYSGIPAGSTIGGMFRILHEISRGAMGVVYRGEDMGLGRPVAIKVLRSDLAEDRKLVGQFRDEAARLAALQHRNLVQVYSFGEDGDDVFFVMELVEGEPLGDIIDRLADKSRWVTSEKVIKIVDEIAAALEAMHAAGIIHRDVKPANVLLDRIHDRAVLVDVGIAKGAHEAVEAAGTPGFAAPESFTETEETSATDVYGLATTSYAMLTGGPPFGGGEVLTVVKRQMFESLPPPSATRPDLPAAIDEVFSRALAPRPGDRFESATGFAIALARALVGRAASTPAEPETPGPARLEPPPPPFQMPAVSISGGAFLTPTPAAAARAPVTASATPPVDQGLVLEESYGDSRGVFFSIARKLIAHVCVDDALDAMAANSSAVAEALDPGLHPNDWYPVERLIDLLHAVTPHTNDTPRFAMRLGRSVISATLTHVYGAELTKAGPLELLRAAPSYWHRYNTWGELEIERAESKLTEIHLGGNPPDDLLIAAMVGGMLQRIPEVAGANGVSLRRGIRTYEISWH